MQGFNRYEREMAEFREGKLHEIYHEFLSYLKRHPGSILSRDLERKFNISGAEIRAMVQYARRQSTPIASSGLGYRYARNETEMASTIRHLTERRDSLTYTIAQLEKADSVYIAPPAHDDEQQLVDFYAEMRAM